jgi:hypothetical protein
MYDNLSYPRKDDKYCEAYIMDLLCGEEYHHSLQEECGFQKIVPSQTRLEFASVRMHVILARAILAVKTRPEVASSPS